MSHYTRITDYSETQNGLLKTRSDLFNEAELLTERLASIKNDVSALDRTLRTIGYEGELGYDYAALSEVGQVRSGRLGQGCDV